MEGFKVRRLPVVDREDNLVGLVTADDLFALLAREIFNVSQALQPALQEKGPLGYRPQLSVVASELSELHIRIKHLQSPQPG